MRLTPFGPTRTVTEADLTARDAAEGVAQQPNVDFALTTRPRTSGERSLVQWLVENGGLKPTDGDIRQIMDGARSRFSLMNSRRMSADQVVIRARESGFFPEYPNLPNQPDAGCERAAERD